MTQAFIPVRLNLAIATALIAVNVAMLAGVPLLVSRSPAWGWVLLVPVLLTMPLWSIIHEAIHGRLHPDRQWNDRFGRALGVVFGAPFQLLRLGHLMHHRYNRSPLCRMEIAPASPTPLRRAGYYGRLLGGLYLGEFLASVLAILPDRLYRPVIRLAFGDEAPDGRTMWDGARRQLLEEPGRSRMRLDGLLVTLAFAGAFLLYGPHWWMLALALAGRAFLISFFDNVYHYANPLDDVTAGYDLRLLPPLQALFLNFNLHGTHHRRADVPWTALPQTFRALGRGYKDGFARAALRQLSGPIPEQALRKECAGPRCANLTRTAPVRTGYTKER